MSKNEIITYLSGIREISKNDGLEIDTMALTVAIDAIVALDSIKKDLVQVEAPNVADSYIDSCLLVINNVFKDCI